MGGLQPPGLRIGKQRPGCGLEAVMRSLSSGIRFTALGRRPGQGQSECDVNANFTWVYPVNCLYCASVDMAVA